jgi:hypothetical protein
MGGDEQILYIVWNVQLSSVEAQIGGVAYGEYHTLHSEPAPTRVDYPLYAAVMTQFWMNLNSTQQLS